MKVGETVLEEDALSDVDFAQIRKQAFCMFVWRCAACPSVHLSVFPPGKFSFDGQSTHCLLYV